MNEGVITGWDPRTCLCCGGLMINFEGNTNPFDGDFYLISNDAAELGITGKTKFPVRMNVNWVKDTTVCRLANYIIIKSFRY